mmetsp:Transcript_1222/g.3220  ORF Transcript_1222/g.3220 Transcript_1222/m.3220 type:complete len:263 (-) Transcript_1222:24-812(-)
MSSVSQRSTSSSSGRAFGRVSRRCSTGAITKERDANYSSGCASCQGSFESLAMNSPSHRSTSGLSDEWNQGGAMDDVIMLRICDFLDFLEDSGTQNVSSRIASKVLRSMYSEGRVQLPTLVTAILYLQRLDNSGVTLNCRTIRSLFLVATMTAAKFLDDDCPRNGSWARMGLLSPASVNALEREFLATVGFRLFASREEFDAVAADLLAFDLARGLACSALAQRFRTLRLPPHAATAPHPLPSAKMMPPTRVPPLPLPLPRH